uniref:N-acetyltransferase domain-containing protein n=1 Tax=Stomoxys calcitrans TaxID=35570 RepID=A0A1I8NLS5_STOCA
MADNKFKIRIIMPEDQERVIHFYIENFYRYEPVFSSTPKMVPGPRDLADIVECIRGGTSIICYHESDKAEEEIVGAFLCTAKERTYVRKLFEAAALEGNTKYGHYLRLLGILHREAAICNRYKVEEIFFTFMACVAPKWRHRNILKLLGDESIALATKLGYKVYTVDCTSNFSSRVCESLKMDRLVTLRYDEFLDTNGKPYFVIPHPHVAAITYAIRLPYQLKAFKSTSKL